MQTDLYYVKFLYLWVYVCTVVFKRRSPLTFVCHNFNMSCVAPEGKKITTCCLVIHSCCHFPCSPPSSKMIQFLVSAVEKSWWIHIHVPRRCLNQHHTITGWESSGALKCDYLYTQLCVNIHKRKGFSMLFFFLEKFINIILIKNTVGSFPAAFM